MSSEICQFCGIEIQFRTIQGKAIPLHPTGSTCPGKRLYRDEERDCCHLTSCPKCDDPVYFIRHNGGCAWFEDLGKPWDKHLCFAAESKLPPGWEKYLHQGWTLRYLGLLGVLTDHSGGVFVHSKDKPDYRESFQYVYQVKIQRDGCTVNQIEDLHLKTVLLNRDESAVIAPDFTTWSVSEHGPSFRKETHSIRRLP